MSFIKNISKNYISIQMKNIYITLDINKNELLSNLEILILCTFKITVLKFELKFLKDKKIYAMCNKK